MLVGTAVCQCPSKVASEQIVSERLRADMSDEDLSQNSSYYEQLVEHIFISEVLQEVLYSFGKTVEVLRSEVDAFGYDVVFECNRVLRHIQLKSSKADAKARKQNVNVALADKPGGCVIWLFREENPNTHRMDLSFLRFGSEAGLPPPSLNGFKVAKHSKGDAKGVKKERRAIREIPKSAFTSVPTTTELVEWLFGLKRPGELANPAHDGPTMPSSEPLIGDDLILSQIAALKRASHRSWGDLRRGCLDFLGRKPLHKTDQVRDSSKAFAKRASEVTGLDYAQLLAFLNKHDL